MVYSPRRGHFFSYLFAVRTFFEKKGQIMNRHWYFATSLLISAFVAECAPLDG